jgi:hypothetical protein
MWAATTTSGAEEVMVPMLNHALPLISPLESSVMTAAYSLSRVRSLFLVLLGCATCQWQVDALPGLNQGNSEHTDSLQ